MAKVLVERPRIVGGAFHKPKGYKKRLRKFLDAGDSPPIHEGIKRPHPRTKHFSEHLGPLRKYVSSQVGRPWDKVHSEICAHIDRGNLVQKHILTHLYDFVVTTVVLIDGQVCDATPGYWYGKPLRWSRVECYVCPKSGILRRVPRPRKQTAPPAPKPPDVVRVNDRLQCRFINGKWELVTLVPLPDDYHRPTNDDRDVILNRPVRAITPNEARDAYGAAVYATSRRVLGKREARQYPIPIDFLRSR